MPEHVVVVFFGLRHAARLVQLREDDGEQSQRVRHADPAPGARRGERPQQFLADSFGGRARKQRRVAPHERLRGFVNRQPGFGGQANRPKQPNRVGFERRIARGADDAVAQIARAAERVEDAPAPIAAKRGRELDRHRVDREIAQREVAFDAVRERGQVEIGAFAVRARYHAGDVALGVERHELPAERGGYLGRERVRRGGYGDVDVARGAPHHRVPNRAADQIGGDAAFREEPVRALQHRLGARTRLRDRARCAGRGGRERRSRIRLRGRVRARKFAAHRTTIEDGVSRSAPSALGVAMGREIPRSASAGADCGRISSLTSLSSL